MGGAAPGWTDVRVELAVSRILRAGVLVASALVLAGGALYLVRHGAELPHYRVFEGEPRELVSATAIARDALAGSARGVIQLGVLVLLATPVARVAFSVLAFALQRDRLYVGVTLVVLAVLAYSLLGGPVDEAAHASDPRSEQEVGEAGQQLAAVLDSMEVEKHWLAGHHVHWKTGEPDARPVPTTGSHTHCSAFVAAACFRLGIPILEPPEHPQVLLATAQCAWLRDAGPAAGWTPVADGLAAQRLANR